LRIGIGNELEAEIDIAAFEEHPVEVIEVLAD